MKLRLKYLGETKPNTYRTNKSRNSQTFANFWFQLWMKHQLESFAGCLHGYFCTGCLWSDSNEGRSWTAELPSSLTPLQLHLQLLLTNISLLRTDSDFSPFNKVELRVSQIKTRASESHTHTHTHNIVQLLLTISLDSALGSAIGAFYWFLVSLMKSLCSVLVMQDTQQPY